MAEAKSIDVYEKDECGWRYRINACHWNDVKPALGQANRFVQAISDQVKTLHDLSPLGTLIEDNI
jgi:hypothetical protein